MAAGGAALRDPPPSAAVRDRAAPGRVGGGEWRRGGPVMGGERRARAGEADGGQRWWAAVGGRWDCADAILVCFCRRLERAEARPGTMVRRRPGSGSVGLGNVGWGLSRWSRGPFPGVREDERDPHPGQGAGRGELSAPCDDSADPCVGVVLLPEERLSLSWLQGAEMPQEGLGRGSGGSRTSRGVRRSQAVSSVSVLLAASQD